MSEDNTDAGVRNANRLFSRHTPNSSNLSRSVVRETLDKVAKLQQIPERLTIDPAKSKQENIDACNVLGELTQTLKGIASYSATQSMKDRLQQQTTEEAPTSTVSKGNIY